MSKGPIPAICTALSLAGAPLFAPLSYAEALRFDTTGYRIADYRAPVPDQAPAGRIVGAEEVEALHGRGALLLDVMGLRHFRITDDGGWLVPEQHLSLPGAVWLPVVGWGQLEGWQQGYLDESLAQLTGTDMSKPVVVFCMVDCWLSWNTVKRLDAGGYSEIYWFSGGVEAWADAGHDLVALEPYPLGRSRPE